MKKLYFFIKFSIFSLISITIIILGFYTYAYLTPKEDYEAIFTCPPYYNIEIYSENGAENLSYTKFLAWWKQSIINSLKPSCKYFSFVINHTLKQDIENVCLSLGLNKLKEISLGKQQYSHLNKSSRNKGEKGEYLLIFNFQ